MLEINAFRCTMYDLFFHPTFFLSKMKRKERKSKEKSRKIYRIVYRSCSMARFFSSSSSSSFFLVWFALVWFQFVKLMYGCRIVWNSPTVITSWDVSGSNSMASKCVTYLFFLSFSSSSSRFLWPLLLFVNALLFFSCISSRRKRRERRRRFDSGVNVHLHNIYIYFIQSSFCQTFLPLSLSLARSLARSPLLN